jgi:tocopherol O-methyltransferase
MNTDPVRAYYDQTWFDYRTFWFSPDNHAIHFGYWDETTHSHADSLVAMNRVMAQRVAVRKGDYILDAGCGVGSAAIWLAETYPVRVCGITIVASQVKYAHQYARQHHVEDRVQFDQQDFRRTNFADETFDIVWAEESVCHLPDKREFIAEAHRLLKPGGRLIMLEYFRVARPYDNSSERLIQSWLSGWAIPNLATAAEFARWTSEAGFVDVALEDISSHVTPSHRRLYRVTLRLYVFEWLLHVIGFRSDVQHGNTRGARDQWRALQRGLWFEGILSARKPHPS